MTALISPATRRPTSVGDFRLDDAADELMSRHAAITHIAARDFEIGSADSRQLDLDDALARQRRRIGVIGAQVQICRRKPGRAWDRIETEKPRRWHPSRDAEGARLRKRISRRPCSRDSSRNSICQTKRECLPARRFCRCSPTTDSALLELSDLEESEVEDSVLAESVLGESALGGGIATRLGVVGSVPAGALQDE